MTCKRVALSALVALAFASSLSAQAPTSCPALGDVRNWPLVLIKLTSGQSALIPKNIEDVAVLERSPKIAQPKNPANGTLTDALCSQQQQETQENQADIFQSWTPGRDRRILASKPSHVLFAVLWDSGESSGVKLTEEKEEARSTRLGEDIKALLSIKQGAAGVRGGPTFISVSVFDVPLKEKRAKLTVQFESIPRQKDQNPVKLGVELVTGPAEHFLLAADLPINKVSELQYDSQSNTLKAKKTPTVFYASLDWMVGDVKRDYSKVGSNPRPWDRLVAKILVRGNKRPFDSLGPGAGYQLQDLQWFGVKLSALQPFVAVIWDKNDTAIPQAAGKVPTSYKANFRIGLAFSISTLKDWVKK
jgi:hypothetical protein